jgi:hypothetical protein
MIKMLFNFFNNFFNEDPAPKKAQKKGKFHIPIKVVDRLQ